MIFLFRVFFLSAIFVNAGVALYSTEFDKRLTETSLQNLQKKVAVELKDAGATTALFLAYENGTCKAGRVFEIKPSKEKFDYKNTVFPLGKSSVALVSLMALNMQECGLLKVSSNVSSYFSKFRTSHGDVNGVTFENLLSQTAGVPYLADKIPLDSSAEEFLDTLAQMNFSISGTSYYPSVASQAVACYGLAYLFENSSKDLKKSFVRASRKYLFTPLKIDVVKFRNYDKWSFPVVSFALSLEGIEHWLVCETSKNPPILTATYIASRRSKFSIDSPFSNGWQKVENAPMEAVCMKSSHNVNIIYRTGNDSFALSLFVKDGDEKKLSKIFSRIIERVNLLLTENKN